MTIDDVARLAGELAGVRRTTRDGLAEGDAGAIEDALTAAWDLQRRAD
jgi:hypothetical protein